MISSSDVKRFWSKVPKTKGCWLWLAGKDKDGYGKIKIGDKYYRSHRLSYILSKGKIPKGYYVCHHCDNSSCVRPSHLFLGTPHQNTLDSIIKGRHPGKKSATNKEVVAMRRRYLTENITQSQLAREYGYPISSVYSILTMRTRKVAK